jgi:enoyl-CoA hydratase/carnithine racemase
MLRIRESPVFLERARQNLPLSTSSVELDRLNEVQLREFTAALIKDLKAKGARALTFERRMFHALFATADQKEGMAAFLEKREPRFYNV